MTNYNERLDKILMGVWHEGYNRCNQEKNHPDGYDNYSYSINENQAKQALTSLTKELVAEAKPESQSWDGLEPVVQIALSARRKAIDDFEQNLLKALEEV